MIKKSVLLITSTINKTEVGQNIQVVEIQFTRCGTKLCRKLLIAHSSYNVAQRRFLKFDKKVWMSIPAFTSAEINLLRSDSIEGPFSCAENSDNDGTRTKR